MAVSLEDVEFERPTDIWTYRARPNRWTDKTLGVVDGDTYHLVVDLGLEVWVPLSVRAWHTDTAELYGASDQDEYEMAVQQATFVREWMVDAMKYARETEGVPEQWPLLIRTKGETGGYGRWLGEVFNWDGESLEEAVIREYGEEYLYNR